MKPEKKLHCEIGPDAPAAGAKAIHKRPPLHPSLSATELDAACGCLMRVPWYEDEERVQSEFDPGFVMRVFRLRLQHPGAIVLHQNAGESDLFLVLADQAERVAAELGGEVLYEPCDNEFVAVYGLRMDGLGVCAKKIAAWCRADVLIVYVGVPRPCCPSPRRFEWFRVEDVLRDVHDESKA